MNEQGQVDHETVCPSFHFKAFEKDIRPEKVHSFVDNVILVRAAEGRTGNKHSGEHGCGDRGGRGEHVTIEKDSPSPWLANKSLACGRSSASKGSNLAGGAGPRTEVFKGKTAMRHTSLHSTSFIVEL